MQFLQWVAECNFCNGWLNAIFAMGGCMQFLQWVAECNFCNGRQNATFAMGG